MKVLLIVLPVLLYMAINKYLMDNYELSSFMNRRVLFVSLPVYAFFAYFYDFTTTSLLYSLCLGVMFSVTAIDLDKHLIPNQLVGILLFFGICNLFMNLHLYRLLLSGFALTFAMGVFLYWITKGSIGGGDIKLLSVLGLLVGFYNIYIIVLVSFLVAAVTGMIRIISKKATAKTPMAFGPFIALGFLVVSFI